MANVRTRRDGSVRWIELDSGRRNLLDVNTIDGLRRALAPDPDAPVAVLSGRDDAFCAGLDVRILQAEASAREALLATMGELLLEIVEGPTRVVVVCRGHAVAAGAMLLLAADVRLGVPGDYRIGFTEPALGMPLPELPALLARERLDRRRLHELTVLGRVVGAAEATEVGFLDRLVDPGDIEAQALQAARSLATLTPEAYVGSRRALLGARLERMREMVARQRARAAAVASN